MIIKDERFLNERTTSYWEKQLPLNIVFIIVGAQATRLTGRQENKLTGNWKTVTKITPGLTADVIQWTLSRRKTSFKRAKVYFYKKSMFSGFWLFVCGWWDVQRRYGKWYTAPSWVKTMKTLSGFTLWQLNIQRTSSVSISTNQSSIKLNVTSYLSAFTPQIKKKSFSLWWVFILKWRKNKVIHKKHMFFRVFVSFSHAISEAMRFPDGSCDPERTSC